METGGYKEVIVWEWLDESVWLPYPSHVSNYIEQEYKSSSNTATSAVIPLARIEYAYRTYQIDTVRSVQENTYTGCCRPVRRELYKSPSPLAEGIFWEWNVMPHVWKPYNSKDAEQLESAYSKQAVSLMICVAEHQYYIDLNNMTQTNQATGFMRNIKRHLLTMPYLVNNTPSSTTYQNQNVIARQCISPTSNTTSGTPNPAASNHLVDSFTTKVAKPEDDDCVICCEKLSSPSGYDSHDSMVLQLLRCKHQYHRACLLQMYKAGNENGGFQCPVCKCIYGLKVGNCPPGTIKVVTLPTSLPGYPNCGTIAITYNIRGGVQGSDHPNPGKPFTARGFPRTGYLPDNTKGRKVSRLLQEAWKRRLTFTVGTSSTTGEQDTVIWNEIHHKTSMENYTGHGYPDPNYLDNVLKELEQQGVVDS